MNEKQDIKTSPPGQVEHDDLVLRTSANAPGAGAIDAAAARAVIEAEAQSRANDAAQEYDAAVAAIKAKYNCDVLYMAQLTPDGRITARPLIAPR